MSRTHFLLHDDIKFASKQELLNHDHTNRGKRSAWETRGHSGSAGWTRSSGINPVGWQTLAVSGALALALVGTLFLNLALTTPFLNGELLLLIGLLGLALGFHAVVGSIWLAATSTERPRLGLCLGGLALIAGIAMPVLEATLRSPLPQQVERHTCSHNLAMLQLLVERYERESGERLESAGTESLRPVWNRYRNTHAHAFFCPDSLEHEELMAAGTRLRDTSYENISYTGAQFSADLRAHDGIDVGPPLLWEKRANHGSGVQVYLAMLGARILTPEALTAEISTYEKVQETQEQGLVGR